MGNSISILSTKALDNALIEKAAQQGIRIECQSFIRTIPNLTDEIKEQLDVITQREAYVALTSANTVTILSEYLDRVLNWKLFCISGQTHEAVKNKLAGLQVLDTAETGGQLAEKIKAQSEIKEVIFLGSNIRTPGLKNGLADSRISLTEIFLYKTEPTPVKIDKKYSGILFFSPSAVKSFFSGNTTPDTATFFTIGTTTANALSGYTNEVITSEQPSQESLINKLIEYYNKAS
jgi:uroporphyrinogen-III synthase